MEKELCKIVFQEINADVINKIVKEILNYEGNKTVDYDLINNNNEKYILVYERDFNEQELEDQKTYERIKNKNNALRIIGAFGQRNVF